MRDYNAPVDYPRMTYRWSQHHQRYLRHVEAHGLPCQECGGRGEQPSGSWYEPPEPCGFCETTGKVTRWMRGFWLRWRRSEKRQSGGPAVSGERAQL